MRYPYVFAILCLTVTVLVKGDPIPPATQPFVIGVWSQPHDSLDKWKARGINTLFNVDLGGPHPTDRATYIAEAKARGVRIIAQPTTPPTVDPDVWGWNHQDEPDGGGNLAPDVIASEGAAWLAFNPGKMRVLNFDGWKTQWRPSTDYQTYSTGADWLAFDYYVINRGEGPSSIPKIGERLRWLKSLAPTKRYLVFIECSNQLLSKQGWAQGNDATGTPLAPKMRGPTPTEMLAEIQQAVDNGANGIVYFPDIVGTNFEEYDGVTPDLEAAMKQINMALSQKMTPSIVRPAATQPFLPDTLIINGATYRKAS